MNYFLRKVFTTDQLLLKNKDAVSHHCMPYFVCLILINVNGFKCWQFENYSKKSWQWRLTWLQCLRMAFPLPCMDTKYHIYRKQGLIMQRAELVSSRVIKNIAACKECNWIDCKRKNVKLKRCKNCKSVYYCSIKCQKKDWKCSNGNVKSHKHYCKFLKSRDIRFTLCK